MGETYIFYVLKILIGGGGGHGPPDPPSGYASALKIKIPRDTH